MTFLAPTVLAGLGAVAVPVAIHLLNKTRVKIVRWGATRFLLESFKKNQRRLQVEDLILLLLRCAFIALLAFAFARPIINPGGALAAGAGGPAIAILLLDQSASMQQSNGYETRFDHAKAAARKVLDGLEPNSQAALFLVTNRVSQVTGRPNANLAIVRHALDAAEPSSRSADLVAGIKTALESLKPFSGTRKQIYVFSDNQASAWAQRGELKALLAGAPEVELRVDPSLDHGEDNIGITGLELASGVAAAGELAGCSVEVSNFGSRAASNVRVTLAVDDGAPVDEAAIDNIEPGHARSIRLNARFPKPGYYTLRANLPPDRFPADDKRALAVHVIDHLNVEIVEGSEKSAAQDRDGFFISNALAPVSPTRRANYYLKTQTQPAAWLQTADLSKQQVVFLCDLPRVDPVAAKNLQTFVNNGGALVVFAGPQTQPAGYNDEPTMRDLMPAKLDAVKQAGPEAGGWQARDYRHPITSIWNDAQNGNLKSVRASTFTPMTLAQPKPGTDAARSVVTYVDGTPAVAEKTFGKGRVLVFGNSSTTSGTNLPIHPDFVPLLHRVIEFVCPDQLTQTLNVTPGATFQAAVAADLVGREVTVVRPDTKGAPQPAGKVELVNQEAVVRYRNTEDAGGYRLFAAGNEGAIAAFAVRLEPNESDLRTLSAAELADISGKPAATEAATAAPSMHVRREFWTLLICMAAAVALIEMVFAHKVSFAK